MNSHDLTGNEGRENKGERLQKPSPELIHKAMEGDFAALQEICLKRDSFYPEQLQALARHLEYFVTIAYKNGNIKINPKATPNQINNYAYCLMHGIGVPQSKDKAAEYFELASKKDNTDAMVNLAQLRSEKGLEPAHSYESKLLKKAAKMGNMAAMDIIYESYKDIEMPRNPGGEFCKGYEGQQLKFY